MSEETKKGTKEIADSLLDWAKSDGKKPRKWAKIPVPALKECVEDLKAASDAEWNEAAERIAEWEKHGEYLTGLLRRLLPHLGPAEAILRKACRNMEKDNADAGILAQALNGANEFSTLIGEMRKAVGLI